MDKKAIEQKVRTILVKLLKRRGLSHEVKNTDSLIGSGILDSLNALELVAGLEKAFKIKIAPEEMSESNFDSILKITDLIGSKSSGA